ncbi:MAG: carbohydrate-binding protein, partial [Fibrobacter sp.]|nr:carbohydrate-binding protein [Fibrobacter sp.]
PHLGYYLPDAVKNLTKPEIQVVGEPVVIVPDESDDYPVVKDGKSALEACSPAEGQGFACETNNAGYEQEGFYNFDNSMGSYGQWEIFSPKDMKTTLTIRFANGGTSNRNMSLSVNGRTVSIVDFAPGGWTTYTEATVDIALKAGKNILKLTSMTSDGGPNVDTFTFAADGIEIYANQKVPEQGGASGGETDSIPEVVSTNIFGLNAYNPYTGVLRSRRAGDAQIIVYDMRGHVVGSIYASVKEGLNVVAIDREMLPRGKYIVKADVNGVAISKSVFSLKK